MDVGAWALGAVILFAVLPRRLAPLAAVVASMDIYIGYAVGGVTDSLFVPLLVGAAVSWDQFASPRGPAAWRGPVLLGLAMAVKQTPWLVAPVRGGGHHAGIRRDAAPQALRTACGTPASRWPRSCVPNLRTWSARPGPGCAGS